MTDFEGQLDKCTTKEQAIKLLQDAFNRHGSYMLNRFPQFATASFEETKAGAKDLLHQLADHN